MEYMQLGKTDLTVSRICFGCWQLSPRFWGDIDLEPWRKAVRRAVDLGVNFIDTAGAYGDGHAETCLGDFLHAEGLRDRFIIATKTYWNFKAPERHPDTTYDFIIRDCEDALQRLKTDRIDLYQIHAWDHLTRPDEAAAAMTKLRQDGKIRWIGVSNLNVEQIALYHKYMDVESLQPPYSLLTRGVEERELPFCVERRIGVMAYSPLYRGLLTGKYARDHTFTDDRANLPLFKGKAFHAILDALDAIRPIADEYGLTVGQLAIRWVLSHPALTTAIVGIKTPQQIESMVPAVGKPLSQLHWYKMANTLTKAKKNADEQS